MTGGSHTRQDDQTPDRRIPHPTGVSHTRQKDPKPDRIIPHQTGGSPTLQEDPTPDRRILHLTGGPPHFVSSISVPLLAIQTTSLKSTFDSTKVKQYNYRV